MPTNVRGNGTANGPAGLRRHLVWASGLWIAPVWLICFLLLPMSRLGTVLLTSAALALAPLPAIFLSRRQRAFLALQAGTATEEVEALKQQLSTIGHRVGRLREELSAANQQSRLSHQLTLLGQFTAGFLHEFNNPLAIVTNRLEILLDERKEDTSLCADLERMLAESSYMGNIAKTLLSALHRERSAEAFTPCLPADAIREALASLEPSARNHGIRVVVETPEVPSVNLPGHSVCEVVRGLMANAVTALAGREDSVIWLRLEPYRSAGAKVVLRVEDNGPGVPESIRGSLFQPFASQSPGREHLGLGLFLAASLLDTYDGALRYEPRSGGGASFIVEMPAARFTRSQPYHWFVKGGPA